MVSRREIFSLPSLDGRVMPEEEFQRRWKAMDREERQWLREAGLRARREAEPELRLLVAAYVWRELRRLPSYYGGVVAAAVVVHFVLLLAGRPEGGATMVILIAISGVFGLVQTRRLAAALALNIGPPAAPADG